MTFRRTTQAAGDGWQPDQRRREMRILIAALLMGRVVAGITAMVMTMLGKAKLR